MLGKGEDDGDAVLLSDLCSQLDRELTVRKGVDNVWKASEERNSIFYSSGNTIGDGGDATAANDNNGGSDDPLGDAADGVTPLDGYDWVELALALEEYVVHVHMAGDSGAAVSRSESAGLGQHLFASSSSGIAIAAASAASMSPLAIKGYNAEVLLEAVILANGDVYAASNIIFAVEEMISSMKPCRHALGGHCGRSDCRFEHSFACLPCRYWMSSQGCTLRHQSCPFSHSLQTILSGGDDDDGAMSGINRADVQRLLACGDADSKAGGSAGAHRGRGYEYKEDEFPTLALLPPSTAVAGATVQPIGASTGGRTLSVNEDLYQRIFKSSYYSYSNKSAVSSASPASSNSPSYSNSSAAGRASRHATSSFVAEWVDSGKAVGYTYTQARQDARQFALIRNGLFVRARECYLGNKREQARKFSGEGQLANLQMKECHRGAARAIFSAYNPETSIRRGHFDLHGLHVTEAVEILQEVLVLVGDGDFFAETGLSHISVITGSGHHTVGGTGAPRLLQKVQEYFSASGYSFTVIRDGNHFQSGLRVKITYD